MKLLVLISLCVFVRYLLRTLSSTKIVNLHALYLATCALFAIFISQYYKINVGEYRRGNKTWTIQRNWQINVREYRRDNQTWTIQRNWQHRVHKTKKNKAKTQHNICWTPLITNNVNNKTCALLQKTGGKEEPNITNLDIQFNQGNLEQLSYYVYFNQPDLI
jgi:hypothetical protein